ncbi:MAG: LysR family transcriptional regulator [Vreelandella alkaliphila]|uniref:LysR family transcriptional regulator n=1 Tax=Halomonadaceae TaxID=28256 RepID=UPI000E8D35A8|nr:MULTISPECIES: LysR family transcriptional regulator [unclassified Halomonas]WKD29353.1 LysR family transcriptional regulator [Halomonas sp. KG2]HBP41033.1 LysR family transcriptional regulator [Halomonas sp.]HBS82291.1 LysR family transcriptional regulator [Halomonas campaniensis]
MLDALTLDQMRVLIAVSEAGSFSGGAERLGRAQSAVSYAIGNLEAQLGVTLFDRSGYRPVLTPEGRMLLADARAILLKVDTLRARARGFGEGVELGLDIALDPQFPLTVASRALKELQDAYPLVSVRVLSAPLGEAIQLLQQHRCTLAISGIDIPDPRIEREAIVFVPRAAVVSTSHPLANRTASGETITAAELADYVQIVTEDPSTLTRGREYDVLSPGTWRVGDNSTKHALICAGIGWGNLPLWLIERDLLEGRLVRIPAAEFGSEGETVVRMWLMHRTDEHLGPAAKTLKEALIRQAVTLGTE